MIDQIPTLDIFVNFLKSSHLLPRVLSILRGYEEGFSMSEHKAPRTGVMLVVSGPSGTGKTTLLRRLREEFPDFGYSISCTTRTPRSNEKDGRDYYFISEQTFEQRLTQGFFAEWAKVHDHFYGTPLEPLRKALARGQDMLFDVDVQGAAKLRLVFPNASYVFLLPPSMEELEKRLRSRGTDDDTSIRRRLKVAEQEIRESHWFDALIVNDDMDRAYDELRSIFIQLRRKTLPLMDGRFTAATLAPIKQL